MSDDFLVSFDGSRLGDRFDAARAAALRPELSKIHQSLQARSGHGAEMLGWMDLPARRGSDYRRLRTTSLRLRSECDVVVVIGIGGSYLGARALLEALGPRLRANRIDSPDIVFAGHHLEASAYVELLDSLDGRQPALVVISKSGTTTEPAIAFRLLRDRLEETYGAPKAASRILAVTDASRGALRGMSAEKGYETFVVPDDVGGRFSVLSPVGLLPLAVGGVDVDALMDGALAESVRCRDAVELDDAPALQYAAARYAAYSTGAAIEVLASFFPSLHSLGEWWKQLFGESEGKEGQGLFPAAVEYTTDLHSLGQYLQDGQRNLLETFLEVADPLPGPMIPFQSGDADGLDYLAGQRVDAINAQALEAVAQAHQDGGVPSSKIILPSAGEASLGSLVYFFEYAVAVSARLLGLNPFDQPGVEAYKQNLFRLLGKPKHF